MEAAGRPEAKEDLTDNQSQFPGQERAQGDNQGAGTRPRNSVHPEAEPHHRHHGGRERRPRLTGQLLRYTDWNPLGLGQVQDDQHQRLRSHSQLSH